jgi:hypothetical protein
MFKVNLHHSTITICYRNTSFLKHGFRVTACWWLQKMLKVSTLSFHAANAGGRFLEPFSLSHQSDCGCLPQFSTELPSRDADLQTAIQLCSTHDGAPPHFFSLFVYSGRTYFRNMCSTRWTNSMACLFLWLQYLTFWSLETSEVYCLCHRCLKFGTWDEHSMDLRWFVRELEF